MKFELTDSYIDEDGYKLYRIKALRDIESNHPTARSVKAGELGGYVEFEHNLDQVGDCWIYDNAKVFGDSRVTDNAMIMNKSKVYDSKILGYAMVFDEAVVSDSTITGDARIYGKANVDDDCYVGNQVYIYDTAEVSSSVVLDKSQIYGDACVGNSKIFGSLENCVRIFGSAQVYDSVVRWDASLKQGTFIQANIENKKDYIQIGPIGEKNTILTVYIGLRDIWVNDMFTGPGTLEQFAKEEDESIKEAVAFAYKTLTGRDLEEG